MDKVIIVGGGASGIVAALFSKRSNNEVIILERNSTCLKKLLLTGNGRCNFMNENYSIQNYHSQNIDIVDKIISSSNIDMVLNFFQDIGLVFKAKNGCYYPYSNQAKMIQKLLIDEATLRGVQIKCNSFVTDIAKKGDTFLVTCNDEVLRCQKLVIATGSFAYPKTGSDGMGYEFLKKFHHTIVDVVPALVPLISKKKYKVWDGVRCEAELKLFEDNIYKKSEFGEVQLTSYGLSGICTFNLSHDVSRGLHDGKREVIKINFVPFIKTLITPWMHNYCIKFPTRTLEKILEGFLNYKIIPIILKHAKLSKDLYYMDLTNEEKLRLCKALSSFPVEIESTKSFDMSQVCNGGVLLKEIDCHTMESLKEKNLFITGELLDMNGDCGGYNLTTCWISGILAGKCIGDYYDQSK